MSSSVQEMQRESIATPGCMVRFCERNFASSLACSSTTQVRFSQLRNINATERVWYKGSFTNYVSSWVGGGGLGADDTNVLSMGLNAPLHRMNGQSY